jgi:hypothetical protein
MCDFASLMHCVASRTIRVRLVVANLLERSTTGELVSVITGSSTRSLMRFALSGFIACGIVAKPIAEVL